MSAVPVGCVDERAPAVTDRYTGAPIVNDQAVFFIYPRIITPISKPSLLTAIPSKFLDDDAKSASAKTQAVEEFK